MPTTTPEPLRPYVFHGVHLQPINDGEYVGECPWCHRPGKFNVDAATGKWSCWVCRRGNTKGGGNASVFVKMLWGNSNAEIDDYKSLAEDRKLLYPETLIHWGLVKSCITGEWLLPGFNGNVEQTSVYKYSYGKDRWRWLPTPTVGHRILGANLYDSKKSTVYLCEGPWDAMTLWETLGAGKYSGDTVVPTSNKASSLLRDANVLAIPTCSVFFESWLPLFVDKDVVLMGQNDHERTVDGRTVPPASYNGMIRIYGMLKSAAKSVRYLVWGDGGYTKDLSHGFDIRDCIAQPTKGNTVSRRSRRRVGN